MVPFPYQRQSGSPAGGSANEPQPGTGTAGAGLGQEAGHGLINSLRESTIGSWTRQTRGTG